jgi:hypothetical protein
MPSTILSERDANVPMEQQSQQDDRKPKSMEYHRQVLESRMKEGKSVAALTPTEEATKSPSDEATTVAGHSLTKQHAFRNQQTYVSPSDTIMSPATQKLAAFKNKHIKAYEVGSAGERVALTYRNRTKPQSLFAKTASKNVDAAAANGQMFADITPRSEKVGKRDGTAS